MTRKDADPASPFSHSSRFHAALFANDPIPMVIAHRGDSSRALRENTLGGRSPRTSRGRGGLGILTFTSPGRRHCPSSSTTSRSSARPTSPEVFAGDPREARGYPVSQFDLDEIRSLDAGSWFLDPQGGPRSAFDFGTLHAIAREDREQFLSGTVRVPTLDEALGLTSQLGLARERRAEIISQHAATACSTRSSRLLTARGPVLAGF